jgi:putative transposase
MSRRTHPKSKQGCLSFRAWGGARKGSGRKRVGKRACLPHRRRSPLKSSEPHHTTVRLVDDVANVRRWRIFAAIVEAIAAAQRLNFRIVEFSVQDGHLHLITEASGVTALTNGVRALSIRIARAINRLLKRRGKVVADRFHARTLATPREVRNALVYVLQNARKHFQQKGIALRADWLDNFSSAAFFAGWNGVTAKAALALRGEWRSETRELPVPTRAASTWLLGTGWKRHGTISSTEVPASS